MPLWWLPFSFWPPATLAGLKDRACDGFGLAALCPQGPIDMRLMDQAVDAIVNAHYAINRPDLPDELTDEVQRTLIKLGNRLADGQPMPAMRGNFLDHLRTLVQDKDSTENFHDALADLQGAGAATLPGQTDHYLQNVVLHRLKTNSTAEVQQRGAKMATLYHDHEMAQLAQDAYMAADVNLTHSGNRADGIQWSVTQTANRDRTPPVGWTRLSEQPQKMKEFAERMGLDVEQLTDMLRPNKSGFRAEIYLPDENILGPGYKPTLVFKGSGGMVSTADGQSHGTALEDFLGNNLPQSIGMKTDYYDRAMTLGALMKESGIAFEVAGHSLGGGLATAAAAVSGAHATIFNSASLHPETVRRFAKENPEVQVHDISQTTTNYQVRGELLNHGVQDNFSQNMTGVERALLGSAIQDISQLAHDLPAGRALLDNLKAGLPQQAQVTFDAFIDKLAHADPAQLMRDMPPSEGQLRMLEPYQINQQKQLVPRPETASLQEITHAAAPLLPAVAAISQSTTTGMAAGQGLDDAARAYGKAQLVNNNADMALADSVHAGAVDALGEVQARARQTLGQLSRAGADVQSALLGGLAHIPDLAPSAAQQLRAHAQHLTQTGQRAVDSAAAQAQQTLVEARQRSAAIRQESQNRTNETMRALATPDTAPGPMATAGTAVGGVAGAAAVITTTLSSPVATYTVTDSVITLSRRGGPAITEALGRHSMDKTVLPSMAHYVQQQEKLALKALDGPRSAEDAQQRLRLLIQMQSNR